MGDTYEIEHDTGYGEALLRLTTMPSNHYLLKVDENELPALEKLVAKAEANDTLRSAAKELVEAAQELSDKAQVLRVNVGAIHPMHPTDQRNIDEDRHAVVAAQTALGKALLATKAAIGEK